MTVTGVRNGGIDQFTTQATRQRRAARALSNAQSRPLYYSANSKGSAQETKLKLGGAPQELHAHLLNSTKNSAASHGPQHGGSLQHTSDAWALFAHADRTDYWLMGGGLLAAMVSGSSLPSINIVFGTKRTNVDLLGVLHWNANPHSPQNVWTCRSALFLNAQQTRSLH